MQSKENAGLKNTCLNKYTFQNDAVWRNMALEIKLARSIIYLKLKYTWIVLKL